MQSKKAQRRPAAAAGQATGCLTSRRHNELEGHSWAGADQIGWRFATSLSAAPTGGSELLSAACHQKLVLDDRDVYHSNEGWAKSFPRAADVPCTQFSSSFQESRMQARFWAEEPKNRADEAKKKADQKILSGREEGR